MIEIRNDVDIEDFFKEEKGLLEQHWEQVAGNKSVIKLAPDKDKYKALQAAGILKLIAAYEEDLMVGYIALLISPNLHYMNDVFAYVDVIFVKESHRNSRVGLRLIDTAERYCRDTNVSLLSYHTKPLHNAIEKILVRKRN